MSNFDSKVKEENENIKELFNFNGDETQLKHIQEIIKKNESGYNYSIQLIEFYTICRPRQIPFSKQLVEYVFSCFPEHVNEIVENMKPRNQILNFVMFPEENLEDENKKQNEMFLFLQNDDVKGFSTLYPTQTFMIAMVSF